MAGSEVNPPDVKKKQTAKKVKIKELCSRSLSIILLVKQPKKVAVLSRGTLIRRMDRILPSKRMQKSVEPVKLPMKSQIAVI